jgi:hypothetical protein
MLIKLPTEHPPIKGCINLKHINDVMSLDLSNWETDSRNLMIVVDIPLTSGDVAVDFATNLEQQLGHYRTPFPKWGYLPVSMQAWFNDQYLVGDWFYEIRSANDNTNPKYIRKLRIFFQYSVDALLFKLAWSGENEK